MFEGIMSLLAQQLQFMLYIVPAVLVAMVCHECAHGWVSYKLGDPTAKNAGRLTLNPLKHLDLVGTLCMLVFHVGWAKPVPIDPRYYRNRKKGILCVSLAGPVTNFVLAFVSLLLEGLLVKFGSSASAVFWILYRLFYYSAVINVGLGLFNLIPIPPLDGSKIVGALSRWVAVQYVRLQRYWRIILIVLLVTGLLSKPLSWLNGLLIDLMWRFICLILWI